MDAGSCRKRRLKRVGIKIYLRVGCGVNGVGDRRTVIGREGPVFAGLEFGGF